MDKDKKLEDAASAPTPDEPRDEWNMTAPQREVAEKNCESINTDWEGVLRFMVERTGWSREEILLFKVMGSVQRMEAAYAATVELQREMAAIMQDYIPLMRQELDDLRQGENWKKDEEEGGKDWKEE